jgi:tight adherence protein C
VAGILGLSALGCYLLAVRGFVMLRARPAFDVPVTVTGTDLAARRSPITRFYDLLGRRTGPILAPLLPDSLRTQIAVMLASAGQPRGYDVAGFLELQGAYTALGLLAGAVPLSSGSVLSAVLLTGLLFAYPGVWLFSEAQRRQRQIEQELPDFLDILAITVTAGLGFRQALQRVGETLVGPLAEEVRRTLHRMDLGVRRRVAFAELRDRNPRSATMGLFVTAMIQAEELGAPLADTLNQLAGDMRREYSQQARRRAARAAPRVSLIITMVIMPALIGLLVLALVLGSGTSFKDFA